MPFVDRFGLPLTTSWPRRWGIMSGLPDLMLSAKIGAGELLDAANDARTSVIILSDHGFGSLTHAVYLNKFLAQRGVLAYRQQKNNVLASVLRAGVRQLNHPLVNALKQRTFEILPHLKSNLHYSMAYGNMDWSRTRAYAVGTMGNVYLNVRGREPQGIVEAADCEATRTEVIAAMQSLTDPETHAPIFNAVYRREEIYHGDALDLAPDVIGLIDGPYHVAAVDWRVDTKGREIIEKVGDELLFVSDTSGQHRMDGILAAQGAAIISGVQFAQQPQLIDLAPTLAVLLGGAIPENNQGRVLWEVLDTDHAPDVHTYVDLLLQRENALEELKLLKRELASGSMYREEYEEERAEILTRARMNLMAMEQARKEMERRAG